MTLANLVFFWLTFNLLTYQTTNLEKLRFLSKLRLLDLDSFGGSENVFGQTQKKSFSKKVSKFTTCIVLKVCSLIYSK